MRLRRLSSGEAALRRGSGHQLHGHRPAAREARGGGVRCQGGCARRDLRRAGDHLRPLRARRRDQRRHGPEVAGEIVAGAANNQLAEDRHGDELERRGITYAPDYVINGGGLINVNAELHGWAPERARSKAGEIYDTLLRVFEIAREEGVPTYRAADRLAEQRIAAIANVRRNYV